MPGADDREQLVFILHRLEEERARQQRELGELRAELAALVDLLVARGALNEGHKRHLARMAQAPVERKVRLRVFGDKYATAGPDIDCAARFALCQGRCCRLEIVLTEADVREGKLRWDLEQPYVLAKDPDGQCTHMDRATGGCTAYDVRPVTCREYDCRQDKRVWIDFDQRIPAPFYG